jgi:CHASE2 domain-containing sensor protein
VKSAILAAILAATLVIGGALAIPAAPEEAPAVRQASGAIVIVAIDEASLAQIGPWPWRRRVHADLVDALTRAGVRQIAFDILFDTPSADSADDIALAEALKRAPTRPLLAAWPAADGGTLRPIPILAQAGRMALVAAAMDEKKVAQTVPSLPDMASMAARVGSPPHASQLAVDWSIDRRTIPILSAADVLAGRAEGLRGRTVLIAAMSPRLGDMHATPTGASIFGAYIIVLAAESPFGR